MIILADKLVTTINRLQQFIFLQIDFIGEWIINAWAFDKVQNYVCNLEFIILSLLKWFFSQQLMFLEIVFFQIMTKTTLCLWLE